MYEQSLARRKQRAAKRLTKCRTDGFAFTHFLATMPFVFSQ
jgi:hypothetical protein